MNANELTLDGYLQLPYRLRLAAARVPLNQSLDRWREGEQHVNPVYDWCYSPRRYATGPDQAWLWENKLWVTLSVRKNHGYVSAQHWTPDMAQLVSALLGRVIQLTIVVDVPPWGVKSP